MAGSRSVDLNADVGEGGPEAVDEALLHTVTSASIACGGHAGNDDIMFERCRLAEKLGVRIGAHPSYPDPDNFGRVTVEMDPHELAASIEEQIERLRKAAAAAGAEVAYFKPHGALYNDFLRRTEVAGAIIAAASATSLPVMLLASSRLLDVPNVISEGFIDRAYRPDGSLRPRSEPGALILDPELAGRQALDLAGRVDSLCVHSDTPGSVELARAVRSRLEQAGYRVGP